MAYAFEGSNPSAPITPENPAICGVFVLLHAFEQRSSRLSNLPVNGAFGGLTCGWSAPLSAPVRSGIVRWAPSHEFEVVHKALPDRAARRQPVQSPRQYVCAYTVAVA